MTTRFGKTYDNVGNRYKYFSKEEQESWPEGHKGCTTCKVVHPFSMYSPHKNGFGGRYSICRLCRTENSRKKYEKMSYERHIFNRAKSRATKRGRDFSISIEDIHVPEFCPVLGIKLERGKLMMTDASPSLDRIDGSKGYVPGNVIVISNRANRLKNDASVEDLQAVLNWMKSCNLERSGV